MISYIASNFELVYERNLKVPLYIAMNMEGPGSIGHGIVHIADRKDGTKV